MALKNSQSSICLRKTKREKTILQRKHARFKQALNLRLAQLDDDLHTLLQNHAFLEHAVINLAADELEPELWLAGAITHQRWLKQSGGNIVEQLRQVRQWVNQ